MGTLNWLANDTTSVFTLQLPRSRSVPSATFFENNHYIRTLNKILQLELGCIELYKKCAETLQIPDCEELIRIHQCQAKSLVNLIVNNRGIPDQKGFSLPPEIGLIASGLGRRLWHSMAFRTNKASCLHLERLLIRRYQQALGVAPYGDRFILDEHISATNKVIEQIAGIHLP